MKVVFHPEAYEEMLESARFYETRSEGLGADFLDAVEEVTRSIQQFPKAGRIETRCPQAACSWFPLQRSLPGAGSADFHRSGNAPTPTARLLEKAIEVLSFYFDDRYWELPSRKRARIGDLPRLNDRTDLTTSTLRIIPHNGTRFGSASEGLALPD
jgi:hypothetical protein